MEKRKQESINLEAKIKKKLLETSSKNIDDVFNELDTSMQGLSEEEAQERLKEYGLNENVDHGISIF